MILNIQTKYYKGLAFSIRKEMLEIKAMSLNMQTNLIINKTFKRKKYANS